MSESPIVLNYTRGVKPRRPHLWWPWRSLVYLLKFIALLARITTMAVGYVIFAIGTSVSFSAKWVARGMLWAARYRRKAVADPGEAPAGPVPVLPITD